MNIKQLDTFIWIVRLGSFAAAAERLNTTQSAVSARIHELEHAMGVILFDRSHHRAKLTPKGRQLVPYAEHLIAFASEILYRVGSQEAVAGIVRLGIAELVGITRLPALTRAIRETFPQITLEIEIDLTNSLIAKLREGDLDLVRGPGPVIESNLDSRSLGCVQFHWMAGQGLNVPKEVMTPRMLLRYPILALSQASHHFRQIEAWFAGDKALHQFALSCNNMDILATLTASGQGVSLLPAVAYRDEIRTGLLRILRTSPAMPPVEFFIYRPRGRFQPLADAIAALALEVGSFSHPKRRAGENSRARAR